MGSWQRDNPNVQEEKISRGRRNTHTQLVVFIHIDCTTCETGQKVKVWHRCGANSEFIWVFFSKEEDEEEQYLFVEIGVFSIGLQKRRIYEQHSEIWQKRTKTGLL